MDTGIPGDGAGTGAGGSHLMPGFGHPYPKEDEIAMLEEQAQGLERELESIRKRLEELKKKEVKNA